jgi:protein gp37
LRAELARARCTGLGALAARPGVDASVPFFFKQWGEHVADALEDGDVRYRHVGKKLAGRVLDGRTWDEMPATAEVAHA